jgi:hypothetical protein
MDRVGDAFCGAETQPTLKIIEKENHLFWYTGLLLFLREKIYSPISQDSLRPKTH